jgi:hypothetical protein
MMTVELLSGKSGGELTMEKRKGVDGGRETQTDIIEQSHNSRISGVFTEH